MGLDNTVDPGKPDEIEGRDFEEPIAAKLAT
jgi:hypothetical protein